MQKPGRCWVPCRVPLQGLSLPPTREGSCRWGRPSGVGQGTHGRSRGPSSPHTRLCPGRPGRRQPQRRTGTHSPRQCRTHTRRARRPRSRAGGTPVGASLQWPLSTRPIGPRPSCCAAGARPHSARPTWLWQAAKVWLLMMLHFCSAQARRKAFTLQGSSAKLASPHIGLSFHEFTNSSSLDATYLLRVSKSSFMFPL